MKKFKENIYVQLFWTFFKLGLFTIGGGMAMIPLIQGIVAEKKKWLSDDEMVDCIAVSQGLPGVIAINMATYIGNKLKGFKGSLVATVGVILPSFIIIILIIEVLRGIGDSRYVTGALTGIKAAATALICFSAYKVGKQVLKGVFPWVLAVIAFAVIIVFDVNAVWAVLGGLIAGVVYKAIQVHMEKKKHAGGEDL